MDFSGNKFKWLVVTAAILVYAGTLNHRPLYSPDEVRYALIPAEMMASGNFGLPTLNGLPYYEKPALGYWLTALSVQLFGDNAFAVRFPSALFTLLTAYLVFLTGRRQGNRREGVCSTLLYLCSGLVFAVGTFAVLDPPFVFFVTAGTVLWFFYYTEQKTRLKYLWLLLSGLSIGAGIMIKGLLAPVLVFSAILTFSLCKKEFRKFFVSLLPLLAGILISAVPGIVFMHKCAPDFWMDFLLHEHWNRGLLGTGAGDSRSQPFWYYIPVLLAGLMPPALLFPAGIAAIRKRWKEFLLKDDLMLYSAVCCIVWLLFFTLVRAKLATYILVIFPFLFLIAGNALVCAEKENKIFIANRILHILCIVIGIGAAAFLIWHLVPQIPNKLKLYEKYELMPPVLLTGLLLMWYSMAAREKDIFPERKLLYFCIGTGIVMMSVNLVIPRKIQRNFDRISFIRRVVASRLQPGDLVMADGSMAAAAALTLKRNVPVYIKPGEFYAPLKRVGKRAVTPEDLQIIVPEMLKQGRQVVVLTASANRVREMKGKKTVVRAGKLSAVFFTENCK